MEKVKANWKEEEEEENPTFPSERSVKRVFYKLHTPSASL